MSTCVATQVETGKGIAVLKQQAVQPKVQAKAPETEPFIIGPHVTMNGIVQVDGEVWVEGKLEADIRCHRLFIAPLAHVDGVVAADEIEICGRMDGEIFCNHVTVKSNAIVEAELNYRQLALEPGSFFEGRSRRYDEPLNIAPLFQA